jgi:hypothetical protein
MGRIPGLPYVDLSVDESCGLMADGQLDRGETLIAA